MAFALGHRDKYVDFGYRAVHEMTVNAKTIVEAFYGTAPVHSYWNGCSQGGRQGITEAIRYPADFDAIIAGAPAIAHMQLHAARLALNRFVHRSSDSYIPPEKYPAIHRAALNACDALDGVARRPDREPVHVSLRSGGPRMPEWRRSFVPDGRAGRNGARDVRADYRPGDGARSSRPRSCSPAPNWDGDASPAPNRSPTPSSRSSTWCSRTRSGTGGRFVCRPICRARLRVDDGIINRTDPNLRAVFRRRRQAADVSRLVRSAGAAAGHRSRISTRS